VLCDGFAQVGFSEKMINEPVTFLSGGWRMKLALARAMLQKADILLMDEPTNHLDVINVQWTMDYINSLKDVTSIIVSHDSKLVRASLTPLPPPSSAPSWVFVACLLLHSVFGSNGRRISREGQ